MLSYRAGERLDIQLGRGEGLQDLSVFAQTLSKNIGTCSDYREGERLGYQLGLSVVVVVPMLNAYSLNFTPFRLLS